jgi:hypothetical protein
MPTLEVTKRTKLIAAATGAAALISTVLAVSMFSSDEYSREVNAALDDAGVSRTNGEKRLTDLLSAPVEPGAEVTTGVTLPLGWRVTDVAPAGLFTIEKQSHTDREAGTWYEVTARNTGVVTTRFVAFVEFAEPATDGGVP